ncbi:MAG: DUF1801 domain-containing protein [Pyrinomonadaceae bacterium]
MQSKAKTVDEYIESLPEDRQKAISDIRKVVNKNLPKGFEEMMSYGMMGWAVPHELYPAGYHCDPKQPLPFMGLASQKNFISFYSMCLYSDGKLLKWFQKEWPKHSSRKLDMGKSCIRFKKIDDIPLKLIGELASKVTPAQWIEIYEARYLK